MPVSQRRRFGAEREVGGGYVADEDAPSSALHGVQAPLFDAVRWTVKLPSWCTSLTATLWRYSASLDAWTPDQDLGAFTSSFSTTQPLHGARVWLQLADLSGTPDAGDPIRKSWQPIAQEA